MALNSIAVDVAGKAAKLFGVDVSEVFSASRYRSTSAARALAMWAVRRKYNLSYPELAIAFGRDDSTCVVAVQKVERAIRTGEPANLARHAREWP